MFYAFVVHRLKDAVGGAAQTATARGRSASADRTAAKSPASVATFVPDSTYRSLRDTP